MPEESWYNCPKAHLIGYTLLGLSVMVGHLAFCLHLDGTQVPTTTALHFFSVQALISSASNAFASFGSLFLTMAIQVAFVQRFWVTLSAKCHSIKTIDNIVEHSSSPLSPLSYAAWKAAAGLMIIPLLSSTMALVGIFAPGSLRASLTSFGYNTSCFIPVFNTASGEIWTVEGNLVTPSSSSLRMTLAALVAGTYKSPVSPCGSCAYDIVFDAPAMQCRNSSDSFPFESMVVPGSANTGIIWNATHDIVSGGNTITVATAGGYNQDFEAVTCSISSATYEVSVQHGVSQTDVLVNKVTHNKPITKSNMSSSGEIGTFNIALALAEHLVGIRAINFDNMFPIDINTPGLLVNNAHIFYSALGSSGPSGSRSWIWQPTMLSLPQLMQNTSIGIQANPFGGTPESTTVPCQLTTLLYSFNMLHLLLTYGLAISTASICACFGFYAIKKNGRQETLLFSRILSAPINSGSLQPYDIVVVDSDGRLLVNDKYV